MTEVVKACFCSRSTLADTKEVTTVSCLQPSFLRLHENQQASMPTTPTFWSEQRKQGNLAKSCMIPQSYKLKIINMDRSRIVLGSLHVHKRYDSPNSAVLYRSPQDWKEADSRV